MDWASVKAGLVEKVIIALLSSAVGILLANGWNGTIATDIAQIKADVGDIKASNRGRDTFDRCSELRLDRLEHGVKQQGDCRETEYVR